MKKRICENCRFFEGDNIIGLADIEGECHRHAPIPWLNKAIADGDSADTEKHEFLFAEWPLVCGYDWCGEYKPR